MSGTRAGAATLGRIQVAGAVAFALACAALLAATCRSPDTPYLPRAAGARWIAPRLPVHLVPVRVEPERLPTATFERRFELSGVGAGATLRLRAWSEVRVELNGAPLPGLEDEELRGREVRAPLAGLLRAGTNEIRVRVVHTRGPPLLWARIEGVDPPLASGEEWSARLDAPEPRGVELADDTRAPPALLALPTPAQGLRRHGALLAGAALAGAIAWSVGRELGPRARSRIPLAALAAAACLWALVFVRAQERVPLWAGPDAVRHVEYAHWVREHRALPLAGESWAAYHPPLFYVLEAGVLAAAEPAPGGVAERAALRAIPALATLGNVGVALLLARLVFGRRPRELGLAAALAACAPANLLLATYVSNESLHALLANLGVLATAACLLAPRVTLRAAAGLGLLLGLAVLAKVTSLLVVPVAAALVALRAALADGRRPAAAAAAGALVLAGAAAVAGWFFARNWIHFGTPLVWNQDVPGGEAFWQAPGFRTARYYLGFGASLVHPFAAPFRSLWDALYATWWGDGSTGGVATLEAWKPLWDLPAMSASYLLGVPASLAAAAGWLLVARDALRGDDVRRRLALTLLAAVPAVLGFALVQRSLATPYYSFVKASFALGALAPLAVAGAAALAAAHEALARAHPQLPALLYAWLAALAAAVFVAAAG